MALLESCCGCGLAVTSAVLGVYLLVAYVIAFAIELWWIIESTVTLPIPAYLLCLGYFILFTFSALLLHGLSVKRTTFLLVWLFMMGILLGPEAGLVLYLSIHYWRITSMYGLIEVTCWACRLLVNIIGLLCVQSLHSIWREEKSVLLRLEALKTSPPPKLRQDSRERPPSAPSVFQGYQNHGYEQKKIATVAPGKSDADAFGRFQCPQSGEIVGNEDHVNNYVDPYFANGNGPSEFNASSFDPAVIDARLEATPHLIHRKKLKHLDGISEESDVDVNERIIPKTRSLIDFTDVEDVEIAKREFASPLDSRYLTENPTKNFRKSENNLGSLDRKIIKNKNLKILKKLSPFLGKKSGKDVNVYRIQTMPQQQSSRWGKENQSLNVTKLNNQLNRIYSNRGMYLFDEITRKVIFYPPEFFQPAPGIRNRIDSYTSSLSRSSIDTDSEDLRHISDVAL